MDILRSELLKRDKHILQAIHAGAGIDFEKPVNIVKVNGRFTINSLKKAANIESLFNYNAVVVITNRKHMENNNYYVLAYESGFALDFSCYIPYEYREGITGLDHFWGKGNFEETRKSDCIASYFIYQEKQFAVKPDCKKVDFNERLQYVSKIGWSDGRGKHGISQIDVKDRITGKKATYKTHNAGASTDINYFIDKSGYITENKKSDLQQAAKKLKAEKDKKKVDSICFDEDIKSLDNKLELIREKIKTSAGCITDFETAAATYKILSNLRFDIMDLDRLKEANKNKNFSSTEKAVNLINKINKQFDDILSL